MIVRLAFAALLLGFTSIASADCPTQLPNGDKGICSQAFHLFAQCTGNDMVNTWNVEGHPNWGSKIYPWLASPAYVIGVYVKDMSTTDRHGWWMVGDNQQGDTMLWLGPTDDEGLIWYPDGYTWMIPAAAPDDIAKLRYIDLHGPCSSGQASVWVTFFYKQGGAPP